MPYERCEFSPQLKQWRFDQMGCDRVQNLIQVLFLIQCNYYTFLSICFDLKWYSSAWRRLSELQCSTVQNPHRRKKKLFSVFQPVEMSCRKTNRGLFVIDNLSGRGNDVRWANMLRGFLLDVTQERRQYGCMSALKIIRNDSSASSSLPSDVVVVVIDRTCMYII